MYACLWSGGDTPAPTARTCQTVTAEYLPPVRSVRPSSPLPRRHGERSTGQSILFAAHANAIGTQHVQRTGYGGSLEAMRVAQPHVGT